MERQMHCMFVVLERKKNNNVGFLFMSFLEMQLDGTFNFFFFYKLGFDDDDKVFFFSCSLCRSKRENF